MASMLVRHGRELERLWFVVIEVGGDYVSSLR